MTTRSIHAKCGATKDRGLRTLICGRSYGHKTAHHDPDIDISWPAAPNQSKPKCDHGYYLMTDSCPNCDAMEETPHKATPQKVTVPWSRKPYHRCTACALIPSHPIHQDQP